MESILLLIKQHTKWHTEGSKLGMPDRHKWELKRLNEALEVLFDYTFALSIYSLEHNVVKALVLYKHYSVEECITYLESLGSRKTL